VEVNVGAVPDGPVQSDDQPGTNIASLEHQGRASSTHVAGGVRALGTRGSGPGTGSGLRISALEGRSPGGIGIDTELLGGLARWTRDVLGLGRMVHHMGGEQRRSAPDASSRHEGKVRRVSPFESEPGGRIAAGTAAGESSWRDSEQTISRLASVVIEVKLRRRPGPSKPGVKVSGDGQTPVGATGRHVSRPANRSVVRGKSARPGP